MNKFITTLKNIWSIDELRKRILYTVALLFVFRIGTFLVLPGVKAAVLDAVTKQQKATDILGLINMFSGGSFNKGAIFALGVMPYITASIVVQLLGFAIPYFQRLQQREGESGRRQLNRMTRFLTVFITLVQSGAYLTYLQSQGAVSDTVPQSIFWFSNILLLTTGTVFAMWLGERITERGIGNGTSFIIMSGIIDVLPGSIIAEGTKNNPFMFIFEIVLWVAVVMLTIIITQGVRRIPIQFAKRMVGRSSDTAGAASTNRDYLPLKLNASGVMPIIFAQAIMFLPATLIQYTAGAEAQSSAIVRAFSDFTSWQYNVLYFLLVVVFTYVYTALIVNPQQYSDYLKNNNAFIPGVKPGQSTADFIDTLTTRITLPGSIFLACIACLPAVASAFGVDAGFGRFFGGTSLLIMVGVILDTLQQVESHLLMRKYDGLVKSGRLKGRESGIGIQIGSNY
jgi:preprotein translocase subunit SecY